MTDEQRQHISTVLAAAIEALKTIEPHLTDDGVERSNRSRHCIGWVLWEMDKPEDDDDA